MMTFKAVTFQDSLFMNCYFEDVTTLNTYFRNCSFIETVFFNSGMLGGKNPPHSFVPQILQLFGSYFNREKKVKQNTF